jgi:hypothetical protein
MDDKSEKIDPDAYAMNVAFPRYCFFFPKVRVKISSLGSSRPKKIERLKIWSCSSLPYPMLGQFSHLTLWNL